MSGAVLGDLRRREASVLYALRFLAGDDSRVTVSKPALARAMGWRQVSGVRHVITSLERRGLIRVHRIEPHERRANTFEVLPLGRKVAENVEAMAVE